MHRVILTLMVAATVAVGQDQCANVAERLHSESSAEKGWGARLAVDCRIPSLASEIADELGNMHREGHYFSDSYWLEQSLIDALIQFRAPLTDSALASIVERFPVQAVILLLQNPQPSPNLLAAARISGPGKASWVAASNALTTMRASGFAATLLSELQLTHCVSLTEGGDSWPALEYGGLSKPPSLLKVPSGFPPIGWYRLTSQPAPGDELISPGEVAIYLRHISIEPGLETWEPPSDYFHLQSLRVGYLAKLANIPAKEIKQAIEPQTTIRWSTVSNLSADISRVAEDQIQAISKLAKSLGLKPSDLETPMKIEIRIADQRRDRSPVLPPFDPIVFTIHP